MNITEGMAYYRDNLRVPTHAGLLPLSRIMKPWQRRDFETLDPSWGRAMGVQVPGQPKQRAWIERPRGCSKTSDLAAMVCFALAFGQAGLRGIVAAADGEQAGQLLRGVRDVVRANPWMAEGIGDNRNANPGKLKVQAMRVINPATGSEFRVLTSDAPSSYGELCDFVLCDELAVWPSGRGEDFWAALFSTAAKRESCLLAVITNAGWQGTWQWRLREAVRTDPAWYFSRLDNPEEGLVSSALLAEQRRLLPEPAFRRLWLNEWLPEGQGDALAEADIEAACTQGGPMAGAELGWAFAAGLDLGVRHDLSALAVLGVHVGWTERRTQEQPPIPTALKAAVELGLFQANAAKEEVILHPGTGRLRLAELLVWKPAPGGRVDLEEVERAALGIHQRFGLRVMGFDPWQAELLSQRLIRAGVPMEAISYGGTNQKLMATGLLDAFRERGLDLWREPTLMRDLRKLRIVERSYGVRLEADRDRAGHADAAQALALSLLAARRLRHGGGNGIAVQGPLLCWP